MHSSARCTNIHEAAELRTPSNELSDIMRREELLLDMPWKQGLLSIIELCFDARAPARVGLQGASDAFKHAGALVRNHLMPLLEVAGAPRRDALTAFAVLSFEPQTVQLLSEAGPTCACCLASLEHLLSRTFKKQKKYIMMRQTHK